MAGDVSQFDHSSDSDWQDLEFLLSDFARLTKSSVPFGQVARELVDNVVEALAATGATIWMLEGPDRLRVESQNHVGGGDAECDSEHRQRLLSVMRSGRPEVLLPDQWTPRDGVTASTLLLVPICIDDDAAGIIEVVQRPEVVEESLDGNLRFVSLLGELAADHLRRREVRQLRTARQESRQFQEFVRRLHAPLAPSATASELANEGRRMMGCDRASVAIRSGRGFRLAAVSSVDVIHRRSAAVRQLERLIARVSATGDRLWHRDGQRTDRAPQLDRALADYLDESHACTLGVIPLRGMPARDDGDGPLIGALVVEGFDASAWDADQETIDAVAAHGAQALSNALRYQSLPTLPFLRNRSSAGAPTRRGLKWFVAALLAAAVAATFFVQVDFHVYAEGQLQPAGRNHLFAPLDGQVAAVLAAHGDRVDQGQTIIEMASPELDLEIQKIQGEHDATMQRSIAVDSALLDYGSSLDPDAGQFNRLAAEQEELRQLFASQKQRLAVLRAQREMLMVRSPISGEVLTWETDEQLLNRPVMRGQRLLTVANLAGRWEAELRVPDDQAGPILDSLRSNSTPLIGSYELATERGTIYRGEVKQIARRTEVDDDD